MIPIVIKNCLLHSVTYILPVCGGMDCWLIDCGDVDKIIKQGWKIKGVFLTHAHIDHIYGLNKLTSKFPDVIIYTNSEGKEGLINPKLNLSKYLENIGDFVFIQTDNIRVIERRVKYVWADSFYVEILNTPGHAPSCISYRIEEFLFTGDSYIPGIKTLTSFPGSNRQDAQISLQKLKILEKSGLKIMAGHRN